MKKTVRIVAHIECEYQVEVEGQDEAAILAKARVLAEDNHFGQELMLAAESGTVENESIEIVEDEVTSPGSRAPSGA